MPDSTRTGCRLTIAQLFETIVIAGPMADEYPAEIRNDRDALALARRDARERGEREWNELLDGAMEITCRIPPEDLIPELGPSPRIRLDTALAWCISHFGDPIYGKARPADPVEPPDPMARALHPALRFDYYTNVLGGYLIRLLALGRAGHYQLSCLDGVEQIRAERRWFSPGAMRFDPLNNAVVVNGRQFPGVEAWFEEISAGGVEVDTAPADAEADAETGANDNETEEREPTDIEIWMRQREAEALTEEGRPPLKMVDTVAACREHFASRGAEVTRAVAERAFKRAVWPDRRLGRGRPR